MIENYKELANAIFLRAVEDWRAKCKQLYSADDFRKVSFHELRVFFRSEWCKGLVGEVVAEKSLKILEIERKEIVNHIKSGQAGMMINPKHTPYLVGAEIKKQLIDRSLMQKDFAAMLDMTPQRLNAIIRGRVPLVQNLQRKIEAALGLPDGHFDKFKEGVQNSDKQSVSR